MLVKEIILTQTKFESLFHTLYGKLCQAAYRLVQDEHAAEDIVQEIFCTLWRRRDELNVENFEGYLFRAVHNSSLNFLKAQKNFISEETIIDDKRSDFSAEQNLIQKETKSKIDTAINSLPDACRTVFILSRFEGFSNKQIAEALNISVKTVENQMTKALRTLRNALLPIILGIITFINIRG